MRPHKGAFCKSKYAPFLLRNIQAHFSVLCPLLEIFPAPLSLGDIQSPLRTSFYDYISLACLIIGGLLLVIGVWMALHEEWLKTAIFAVFGILVWHISTLFARYAIAASGRQK